MWVPPQRVEPGNPCRAGDPLPCGEHPYYHPDAPVNRPGLTLGGGATSLVGARRERLLRG
jgi:hypothetical protein